MRERDGQGPGGGLGRGRWLHVEAGLFDLCNLGRLECVQVLADGRDHVLVEHRGERHAVLKSHCYPAPGFPPRLVDALTPPESTLPAVDPDARDAARREPG